MPGFYVLGHTLSLQQRLELGFYTPILKMSYLTLKEAMQLFQDPIASK